LPGLTGTKFQLKQQTEQISRIWSNPWKKFCSFSTDTATYSLRKQKVFTKFSKKFKTHTQNFTLVHY